MSAMCQKGAYHMKGLTQRQKIHNLLRVKYPMGLLTSEMIDSFRQWDDEAIKNIKVEPIRRCLQELLAMKKVRKEFTGVRSVDKYGRQHDIARWFAVKEEEEK